ncbi:hypothetical protein ADUPG1_013287 [Aduncisulcus paluster]|uniref:Uncharacterized protein n=1 Tax=Aduncisulcus paluster TaxID=2918883 RepID=A0ABQ5K604_9EUKA|nr:hypothetical protein ADUPG1_013287 [Aduncisulcus paluster]
MEYFYGDDSPFYRVICIRQPKKKSLVNLCFLDKYPPSQAQKILKNYTEKLYGVESVPVKFISILMSSIICGTVPQMLLPFSDFDKNDVFALCHQHISSGFGLSIDPGNLHFIPCQPTYISDVPDRTYESQEVQANGVIRVQSEGGSEEIEFSVPVKKHTGGRTLLVHDFSHDEKDDYTEYTGFDSFESVSSIGDNLISSIKESSLSKTVSVVYVCGSVGGMNYMLFTVFKDRLILAFCHKTSKLSLALSYFERLK